MQIQPPSLTEIIGAVLFALAVLHTFFVGKFHEWAHHFPHGSLRQNLVEFLSETEIVFGLWAALFFVVMIIQHGDIKPASDYIDKLNFTEPKFVLVIMVMAAAKPVLRAAEGVINGAAKLLPLPQNAAFYLVTLGVGPLLGSFITEPAAMTLLALILRQRLFSRDISKAFAYATLGLLLVNVSIGGVLTHFAAPPVLMVASKFGWGIGYMFSHFGWRAMLATLTGAILMILLFPKELRKIAPPEERKSKIPLWLTAMHIFLLALVVVFAHHENIFFGIFMIFLGLTVATKEFQEPLKLREGLLVGFFLAGLVTLGSKQEFWLKPLLASLDATALYFGATGLTAITDNAALTYLGSLSGKLDEPMKYALVAGAVTGGGLTVIANAPNPAGVGILRQSHFFQKHGLSPLGLLIGATIPTLIAITYFWFI
ncbi:MAG: putative Na+/H+ antiporter [Turneriella sp.]|nr:putative Na+/H+ antiporter [Turneriella sp.]